MKKIKDSTVNIVMYHYVRPIKNSKYPNIKGLEIKEFKNQIEKVQQSPFRMNYFGAILAYVLLIFGLYWFIIKENKGLIDAFLLGIIIYGVYEGTTKALLKKWDYKTMIIDTLWGGILMSLTTLIVYRVNVA